MSAKACYNPDGSNRNAMSNATDGWLYSPCDNAADVSMCCAIGPGRDGSQDVCLDSGLCSNDILGDGLVWRESCTDPTWQDPACLKLFVNGTGINSTMGSIFDADGNPLTDVELTVCDNGSFCYGDSNRGCCQQGGGVYLYNGEQVTFDPNATTTTSSTSSSSTTLPPTSTPSTSALPSPSPTPTPASSSSSGLSTGAKAGIGVGVAIGGLAVVALLVWFFFRRRKDKKNQPSELGGDPAPAMLETPKPRHELSSPPPPASSTAPLSEMDGSTSWTTGSEHDPGKKKDDTVDRYA